MQAFICVYRHPTPSRTEIRETRRGNANDPLVSEFVDHYDDADCYYDWGDDPGFFAATKFFGTPCAGSWGVCRRNVRSQLKPGDLIIWFCGKQGLERNRWRYYFVGISTIAHTIARERLWSDPQFADYRRFYNVLAKPVNGVLQQYETFHDYHEDWRKRIEAPYAIFSRDPSESRLEMRKPLYVAEKPPESSVEIWRSDRDAQVSQLEQTLFGQFVIPRRLRSTHPQISHPHIALHNWLGQKGMKQNNVLTRLRADLAEIMN